mgnify:CR=1 FL=1
MLEQLKRVRKQIFRDEKNTQDYLQEFQKVLKNGCFRSATILAWNLFMFFLYKKIEEYGLSQFESDLKREYQKIDHHKLKQLYDLNNYKDEIVLEMGNKIGLFDRNVLKELKGNKEIRNSVAHVTEAKVSPAKLIAFVDSTFGYMRLIHEKKFVDTGFLDKLQEMSEPQITELVHRTPNQERLRIARQIMDQLSRFDVQTYSDLDMRKNHLLYLENAVRYTDDQVSKTQLCNEIISRIVSTTNIVLQRRYVGIIQSTNLSNMEPRLRIRLANILLTGFESTHDFGLEGTFLNALYNLRQTLSKKQIIALINNFLTHFSDTILYSYSALPAARNFVREFKDTIPRSVKARLKRNALLRDAVG